MTKIVIIYLLNGILNHVLQIEHGFKHIDDGAVAIMAMYLKQWRLELALDLFRYEAYQVRMLATTLLGLMAVGNEVQQWDLSNSRVLFTYKLAKLLEK